MDISERIIIDDVIKIYKFTYQGLSILEYKNERDRMVKANFRKTEKSFS